MQVSELVKVPLTTARLPMAVVVVVIDLEKPNDALPSANRWIKLVREQVDQCVAEITRKNPAKAKALHAAAKARRRKTQQLVLGLENAAVKEAAANAAAAAGGAAAEGETEAQKAEAKEACDSAAAAAAAAARQTADVLEQHDAGVPSLWPIPLLIVASK
jgi:hypothetical protein